LSSLEEESAAALGEAPAFLGAHEAIVERADQRRGAPVNSSMALVPRASRALSTSITTLLHTWRVVRGGRALNAARIASRPTIGTSGAVGRVIRPSGA
jgi:hypothetical protein